MSSCGEDVDLLLHEDEDPPQAVFDRESLEEALPVAGLNVEVARHEIGEPPGIRHLGEDLLDRLVGEAELLSELRGALARLAVESEERGVPLVERPHLAGLLDGGLEVPVLFDDPERDAAVLALEE